MLYVCPTPIGNLEDITLRVLRVLKEVDLILAEDTRHTSQLLHHFQISKPLESLHEHNEREKTERILNLLAEGKQLALVSDAGMPGISDPGAWLIQEVIKAGLPLEVLPGANAALVGYLQSGFLEPQFLFYGFLARKSKTRKDELETLSKLPYPIILYESPHRLLSTLQDLKEVFGERQISVSRELTKKFEETIRGTISEIITHFERGKIRGEFVLTLAGVSEEQVPVLTDADILSEIKKLLAQSYTKRTAVEQIAKRYDLSKNQVYKLALTIKNED